MNSCISAVGPIIGLTQLMRIFSGVSSAAMDLLVTTTAPLEPL